MCGAVDVRCVIHCTNECGGTYPRTSRTQNQAQARHVREYEAGAVHATNWARDAGTATATRVALFSPHSRCVVSATTSFAWALDSLLCTGRSARVYTLARAHRCTLHCDMVVCSVANWLQQHSSAAVHAAAQPPTFHPRFLIDVRVLRMKRALPVGCVRATVT